jgi:hypothetical protein
LHPASQLRQRGLDPVPENASSGNGRNLSKSKLI